MNSFSISGGADMQAKNLRTSLGTIALVLGVALLASPAFAQGVAFTATSFAQNVRVEGQNETVGAIQLTSSAGGTIAAGSSIIVTYGAPIAVLSGSVVPTGVHGNTAGWSTSETAGTTTLTLSISQQDVLSPGAGITFSQVRLNVAGSSFATVGSAINATLSGTAPSGQQITFTSSQVQVALVNGSLTGKLASGSPALSTSFSTCALGQSTFTINVTEKFPAALTSLTDELGFTPSPTVTGAATVVSGSTIIVSIAGVPSGVGVLAPSGSASTAPPAFGAPSKTFLASTAANSTLTFSFPVTNTSTASVETFAVGPFTLGASNSGGTGFASGTPSIPVLNGTAPMTFSVSLGPNAASTVPLSFVTNTQFSGNIATLGDCVTNLLFPFVTNQFGFDTALQISNTSLDAKAFGAQAATAGSGSCKLTLFPTDLTTQTATSAGSQPNTPAPFTTTSISAGAVYSTQMSTIFPNMSGYMFAVCSFLDAHGFSYVTNGPATTATISQGLLALVLTSNEFTTPGIRVNNTTYESLGH